MTTTPNTPREPQAYLGRHDHETDWPLLEVGTHVHSWIGVNGVIESVNTAKKGTKTYTIIRDRDGERAFFHRHQVVAR